MRLFALAEVRLLVALALGVMIGTERERRMAEQGEQEPAGMRTFGLVALLGAVLATYFSPVGVALGGAFVGAAALVGYLRTTSEERQGDRGLTTEIGMVLTYALGALATVRPGTASALAVVTTAVLALRRKLHALAIEALTEQELLDAVFFGLAALVVLPLLPDRALVFGVSPFTVWRLVVVVMGLSGVGYVAQRIVGARYGFAIAGFASGFVSAAATVASMGGHARRAPKLERSAIAGASCAGIATVVQLFAVVAAASERALRLALVPLLAALVASVAYGVAFAVRAARGADVEPARGRPFDLRLAVGFALLVSIVTVVARFVHDRFGAAGLLAAAGIAGFADAHAAAGSVAATVDTLSPRVLSAGVLVAYSTNAATKIVIAFSSGPRRYAAGVAAGVLLAVASAWCAFALTS